MAEATATLGSVPLASNQPRYSLLHRQIERDVLPHARDNDIGIIVYSPMARGILTGKVDLTRSFPREMGAQMSPLPPREPRDCAQGARRGRGCGERRRLLARQSRGGLGPASAGCHCSAGGSSDRGTGGGECCRHVRRFAVRCLGAVRTVFEGVRINKRPGA